MQGGFNTVPFSDLFSVTLRADCKPSFPSTLDSVERSLYLSLNYRFFPLVFSPNSSSAR